MTKITIERETLQAALEALTESVDLVQNAYNDDWRHGMPTRKAQLDGVLLALNQHKAAIAALREALAAQPVALQPPIDNAFVAPDCEQFSSNQSDASRLLEILGVALDECRRLAAAQPAPAAVPPDGRVAALESRLQEIGDLAASCRTGPALREAMEEIERIAAPLTDEQIKQIAATPCAIVGSYIHTFARAIERAHGIAAAGEKP